MLFQRKMMRAFATFFGLNITLYCGLYIYLVVSQGHVKVIDKLLNMEKFTWMNQFYNCMSLTMISMIMIWTIITMRRQLQASYYYSHINSELEHGLNFLKLRTIEIESQNKGFSINSHKVTGFIKSELRQAGLDSTINGTIMLPDYSRLFELERDRADMKTIHEIVAKHTAPIGWMIPKELKDQGAYQKELGLLNYKIDRELTKQVKASRSVFMCLNSLKSISYLCDKFKYATADQRHHVHAVQRDAGRGQAKRKQSGGQPALHQQDRRRHLLSARARATARRS